MPPTQKGKQDCLRLVDSWDYGARYGPLAPSAPSWHPIQPGPEAKYPSSAFSCAATLRRTTAYATSHLRVCVHVCFHWPVKQATKVDLKQCDADLGSVESTMRSVNTAHTCASNRIKPQTTVCLCQTDPEGTGSAWNRRERPIPNWSHMTWTYLLTLRLVCSQTNCCCLLPVHSVAFDLNTAFMRSDGGVCGAKIGGYWGAIPFLIAWSYLLGWVVDQGWVVANLWFYFCLCFHQAKMDSILIHSRLS